MNSLSYDTSLCAGHLLVWTWRKLVGGQGECPVLAREYDRFAGLEADALLAAFATFLMLLGRGSRRVLNVGPPYCAGLTADEERMLRLIAAAQTGEGEMACAHLTWLVRRECRDRVMQAAERLAKALRQAGVILPQVRDCAPAPAATLDRMSAQGWIYGTSVRSGNGRVGIGQCGRHGHAATSQTEKQKGGTYDLHGSLTMESVQEKLMK